MIARIQQSMKEKDKGFTLIELLVVIIIIGILAAIAIPVFLNQREKAVDTGIKSDLRSIANELESYYVDRQEYPPSDDDKGSFTIPASTTGGDPVVLQASNDETEFDYTNNDDGTYEIEGVNDANGTGETYVYDSSAGGLQDN